MFKMNRLTKTKDGRKVIPYLIQDNIVFVFDKNKETLPLAFEDFDINPPKPKPKRNSVVMVKGTAPEFNPKVKEPEAIKEPEVIKEPEIIKEPEVFDADDFYGG